MNCLVAGGAGFIGSHLCESLLDSGHRVVCVDKQIMGGDQVKHLEYHPSFTNLKFDLNNLAATNLLFSNYDIDIVYHLAANSDIQKSSSNPEIDFQETFLTTKNLLESMRIHNVKNLFFASSSAVYGNKPGLKLPENYGGLTPVSYYGAAKLSSEAFISAYSYMNDMNTIIFRFPNVIGPRLTHGVIYDFYRKLKMNPKQLNILGNGKQCKPYIYVKDLVSAIQRMTSNINKGVDIYNISVKSYGTTVSKIAEILIEELKLDNVEITYSGGKYGWKGDVPFFSFNISKILRTGWEPKYSSDEAVRQTIRDIISEDIRD